MTKETFKLALASAFAEGNYFGVSTTISSENYLEKYEDEKKKSIDRSVALVESITGFDAEIGE